MFGFLKKPKPQVHTASIPTGRPLQYFLPLEAFTDPETNSQYAIGQRYTVRKGNARLAEKVAIWEGQGKVTTKEIS